jgi:ATP-dependent Lon protease
VDHGRAPGVERQDIDVVIEPDAVIITGAAPAGPDGARGHHPSSGAQAALTLVKAHADTLGFDLVPLEKSDMHIHVPAGAVPKDGPSAGGAMFMALASLLTGRTVRNDTAMTGEISLRGLVLPMLPARNRKDLEDVPEAARKQIDIVWLELVDDALAAALNPPGAREDKNVSGPAAGSSGCQAARWHCHI